MKAIWNGQIIAESDKTIIIEGNHYFPNSALHTQFFKPSEHTSKCFWKGTAHYYTIEVEGKENHNAAWYYPEPYQAAENIKNHVAFWKGVEVID
ncbi:MAG: DUF427 domain-containing protein [Gammaproteobacteria bacterium]|nr:DUF427 domain-containing protein [Gammaproteobacteria bacterium]